MMMLSQVVNMLAQQLENMIPALEESASPLLLARIKRSYGQIQALQSSASVAVNDVLGVASELRLALVDVYAADADMREQVTRFTRLWNGIASRLSVKTA